MCLHLAPRLNQQVGGVIGFSGCLVGDAHLAAEIKSKPKTLLIHGDLDEVVPYESMAQAAQTLSNCQVEVQSITCKNLSHGINEQGIKGAIDFLQTLKLS
jgi:phospholipase/carboxylesterase